MGGPGCVRRCDRCKGIEGRVRGGPCLLGSGWRRTWGNGDSMFGSGRRATNHVVRAVIVTLLVTGAAIGGVQELTSQSSDALTLLSITVSPTTASIAAGTTQQFTATGHYLGGSTADLTSSVTWTSSLTSFATVSSTGLATGVATGASTITATSGLILGTAALTVTPAVLVSISVSPLTASVAAGGTQQFSATGT